MAVGNQPTPTPAPGTPPVAQPLIPGNAPGTLPQPAGPAPTPPAAPAHTTWRERLSGFSGLLIIGISLIVGYLFGVNTWHHKSQAWYVGWAFVVTAMVILVIWFWDWIHGTSATTSVVAAPAVTPAPPAAPPAAPPVAPAASTPCTCSTPPIPAAGTPAGNLTFNGQTWHWDGTNYWCMF